MTHEAAGGGSNGRASPSLLAAVALLLALGACCDCAHPPAAPVAEIRGRELWLDLHSGAMPAWVCGSPRFPNCTMGGSRSGRAFTGRGS